MEAHNTITIKRNNCRIPLLEVRYEGETTCELTFQMLRKRMTSLVEQLNINYADNG